MFGKSNYLSYIVYTKGERNNTLFFDLLNTQNLDSPVGNKTEQKQNDTIKVKKTGTSYQRGFQLLHDTW